MKNRLANNDYMQELRAIGHKHYYTEKAIAEMVKTMKEKGIDGDTIREVKKEMDKKNAFPYSEGECKAYRAWDYTVGKNEEADVVEMSDFLWETEVAGFVVALRTAGFKKFYFTNHSTAVMENLHWFTAAGCKVGNLVTLEKTGLFKEKESILGIEIEL